MENAEFAHPQYIPVIQEAAPTRAEFIRKTYLHLALAVLGFIIVEAIFLNSPFFVNLGLQMTQGITWLLVLGGFMFATSYAEKLAYQATNRRTQYIALSLYVVVEAFIFIPLIVIALSITGDFSLINQAAILTLSLFVGLTLVVLISKQDFTPLKNMLAVGGMVALGLIVAGLLFGFSIGLWFSFAMVGLAAGAILYKTSSMLHNHHNEQHVAAALGLFSALMLLFWYVLSIVSRFSGD